jgi:hypothetical protein
MVQGPRRDDARGMPRSPEPSRFVLEPAVLAAAGRALPALVVPLVVLSGLVASRGGSAERFWAIGVCVVVLLVAAALVAAGIRRGWRARPHRAPGPSSPP